MKKAGVIILGLYDLFLASGAIWIGSLMVWKGDGIFAEEFPDSWAANLPFDSWVMPGILAIIIFGLGNVTAAVFSFKSKHASSWYVSAMMGILFLGGLGFQYILVREMYIVTFPFIVLDVVQLCLSGFVFWSFRKRRVKF